MLALEAERLKWGFDLCSLADRLAGWLARAQESWKDNVKFVGEGLGKWKTTETDSLPLSFYCFLSSIATNSVTSKHINGLTWIFSTSALERRLWRLYGAKKPWNDETLDCEARVFFFFGGETLYAMYSSKMYCIFLRYFTAVFCVWHPKRPTFKETFLFVEKSWMFSIPFFHHGSLASKSYHHSCCTLLWWMKAPMFMRKPNATEVQWRFHDGESCWKRLVSIQ